MHSVTCYIYQYKLVEINLTIITVSFHLELKMSVHLKCTFRISRVHCLTSRIILPNTHAKQIESVKISDSLYLDYPP